MSTNYASSQPSIRVVTRLVELASRAPSFHNTQPWQWRTIENGLELHVDRTRQLPLADPDGRNLLISCGATLDHVGVAAASLGWDTEVERLPEELTSSLIARIVLRQGVPSATADADVRAIEQRCTDRRHLTSWAIPDERLQHLAETASAHGAHAVPLIDVSKKSRTEQLVIRAAALQSSDDQIVAEQRPWIDHSALDGIPSEVLPADDQTTVNASHSRFPDGLLADQGHEVESADGLILFVAGADTQENWLAAGEGLSTMWLAATVMGLSVVPLSQIIEVDETRHALYSDVLGGMGQPMILARIGWLPISRSQITRTSRRPVSDVLTTV